MPNHYYDPEEERRRRLAGAGGASQPFYSLPEAPIRAHSPGFQPTPAIPPAPGPGSEVSRPPYLRDPQSPGDGPDPLTGSGYSDIDELRADPYTTQFEQAALARADELAGERFKSLRQQRVMELARRGITPDSPLFQREMSRIDTEQAKESSGFRRGLQLNRISERERRQGVARGVEYQLDQMERQRLADVLGFLSGNPGYLNAAGNLGGMIASLAGSQAANAQNQANALFGGAGDLFGMLLGQYGQRRSPFSFNFGGGSDYDPTPFYPGGYDE